jgi:RNA polymerase sigma factor (sigma-70 family)
MPPVAPGEVVAILRTAYGDAPDPRLADVLEDFRRQWLSIARRKYPSLAERIEDAVQNALLKLLSPARLDALKDVERLEAWARTLFVNTVLDEVRDAFRERSRRVYLGRDDDDPEEVLRDRVPSGEASLEEAAAQRERLAVIVGCIERVEVARLKFLDGYADKEIAARKRLTRDAVAGQLKRFRKSARAVLADADRSEDVKT